MSSAAIAETATFEVRTRPVSEFEIAGGAPAGTVYEFYTTTLNDILSLELSELSSDFYHHELGTDSAPPISQLSSHYPAITADSWFTMPGATMIMGNGFQLETADMAPQTSRVTLWGDLENHGAVLGHQFGSLTVPQGSAANFSGRMGVVNAADTSWDTYGLDFSVDPSGGFDFQASDPVSPSVAVVPRQWPAIPTVDPPTIDPPTGTPTVVPPTNTPTVAPTDQLPAQFQIQSRSVTEQEIAAGVPAGTVYDLFATTQSDFISFAIDQLSGDYFQHDLGSDSVPAADALVENFPGLSADSWFTAPGNTVTLGEGFQLQDGKETVWGDLDRLGAVDDFHFGRLTVPNGTVADFNGEFTVTNEASTFERYALEFSVDETGALNFAVAEPDYATTSSSAPTQPTTPTSPTLPEVDTPDRTIDIPTVVPPTEPTVDPGPVDLEPPVEVVEVIEYTLPQTPIIVEPPIVLEIPVDQERENPTTPVTLEGELNPTEPSETAVPVDDAVDPDLDTEVIEIEGGRPVVIDVEFIDPTDHWYIDLIEVPELTLIDFAIEDSSVISYRLTDVQLTSDWVFDGGLGADFDGVPGIVAIDAATTVSLSSDVPIFAMALDRSAQTDTAVPEPATICLLAGMLAILGSRRTGNLK